MTGAEVLLQRPLGQFAFTLWGVDVSLLEYMVKIAAIGEVLMLAFSHLFITSQTALPQVTKGFAGALSVIALSFP